MQVPRPDQIRFDPGSCSKIDIENALQRASNWPNEFACNNLYVGTLFDQNGEPVFMDGVLWAQAVVIEGEYLNGKCKVNENDKLAFLIDQMKDLQEEAYDADTHLLVRSAEYYKGATADYKLEFAAPWSGVNDWNAVGDFALMAQDGVVSWVANGKVKVNVDDTLDYLEDQFKDTTTYAANTHLLCKTETVDDGGDKLIRVSGDWSSVNSYSGTGDFVLSLNDAVVSFKALDTTDMGKVKVDSGDALDYLEDQMQNHVLVANLPADYEIMETVTIDNTGDKKISIFWDYPAITDYSEGTEQSLCHDTNGALEWKSLTQITVLTAWRVDGSTQKLQYKTRTAKVFDPGDETDWIDAHTGTETCP